MFEKQIARERAEGYRGLATRLFAPISTIPEADLVVREMSIGLLLVAALQLLMGSRVSPLFALLTGSALAVPALLLLLTRSRVAAMAGFAWYGALFALAFGLGAVKGPFSLAIWVAIFLAIARAGRAAQFKHAAICQPPSPAATQTVNSENAPGNPGA